MKKQHYKNSIGAVAIALSSLCLGALPTAAQNTASIFEARQAGPAAHLTRGPYLQWATTNSIYIVWNTDKAASSIVEYSEGTATRLPQGAGRRRVVSTTKVMRHIVKLTGLRAGTRYTYLIGSNGRRLQAGTFQTAKPAGQPFSFAIWGDSGTGSTAQKQLAAQINRQRPDFLVHTGDLIYNRGEQSNYNRYFFDIYRSTLARVPFYGSLGNHDVGTANGQPFLDNFVLPRNGPPGQTPERNYSFDYGNAHFVVIDSNLNEANLRRDIVPWVERDVHNSRALWKFAVFHHPPYSSGGHGDEPRTLRALTPLFRRLKFDAVFNGHNHVYERFHKIGGVVYIVTGAGGAGRYPRREHRATTAVFNNSDWSFTRIDINGRTLHGRQITRAGKVIDDWKLQK